MNHRISYTQPEAFPRSVRCIVAQVMDAYLNAVIDPQEDFQVLHMIPGLISTNMDSRIHYLDPNGYTGRWFYMGQAHRLR